MGNRRFELFILTALAITLFYMGFTDKLHLLINPKYFVLLVISQVFLALFIIVKLEYKGESKTKIKKSYILFIVMNILLLLPSYDNFQESIANNRTIDLPETVIETPITEENIDKRLESVTLDSSNYLELIDNLYTKSKVYDGTKISTTGFVHYNREMIKGDYFIISRLIMLCCAADSTVYGVLSENLPDLIENDWYNIQGTIKYKSVEINGERREHPVIQIATLEKREPMEDPYIYPEY